MIAPDLFQNDAPTDERPIGVLDSGLGGLRVLDRLMCALPDERFVYLGDTLHMPYGEKTQAHVMGRVSECLHWLCETHRIKMMVIACNTAASVASHLFPDYGVPFVDPVIPICHWLKNASDYRHVGVMATPATVASNRYQQLLDLDLREGALSPSPIKLTQVGCGQLATLIEAGEGESEAVLELLRQYLAPLSAAQVEAIVLGCTHYPYVMETIAALAPGVDILDPAKFMTTEAARLLAQHNACAKPHKGRPVAEVHYFVTADPDRFYQTGLQMPFRALALGKPTIISLPAVPTAALR